MRYKKGDIVIIGFPFSDLSRTKKRPALIISNDTVNNTGDYLVVQVTSKIRNDIFSLPNRFRFSNKTPRIHKATSNPCEKRSYRHFSQGHPVELFIHRINPVELFIHRVNPVELFIHRVNPVELFIHRVNQQ